MKFAVDPVLLLTHVAPALGVVTATLLYFSPLQAARKAAADGSLGDLNALPYPLIAINCLAWVIYAIVTHDQFVFAANCLGLLVGLYMTLIAVNLSDQKTRSRLAAVVLFFAAVLETVGFIGAEEHLKSSQLVFVWGVLANVVLLIFNMSPLSTLVTVLKTRSSASLYLPLAMMQVVNGSLWVAYGLAVHDYFIYLPNAVGTFLGIVQLLLCLVLPSGKQSALEDPLLDPEQPQTS